VPQADGPLLVLGREFDGFSRALSRQLAGSNADFALPEILQLQERVLGAEDPGADLLMVVTDWLPALIGTGRILPLDDFFGVQGPPEGWPDAWHPALRALQRGPDGRTYGVPYHAGPQMFLYRTDLYADPGQRARFAQQYGYPLAPPQDWTQFRDQARWFTRDGHYGTILAGYPDEHNTVYDFLTQLWSRGGELTDDHGRLTLDTPQARAAARFLHDLWHTDRVVDPAAAQWDSVASGVHFAAGEAAMMVNWSGFAAMSAPADSPTHGLVGCAPVPRGAGPHGRRVALNSYWVLAVSASSSRPKQAYDLLRTLTTGPMDRITAQSGGVATRRDSWLDKGIRDSAPYYAQFEQAHNSTRALPRDRRWPRISVVLNEMVARLVAGAGDPDSVLAVAGKQLTAVER
jgi:multiple sugar transport system substrate-binding protein